MTRPFNAWEFAAVEKERDDLRRRLGRLRACVKQWGWRADANRGRFIRLHLTEIRDALADKPPTARRAKP